MQYTTTFEEITDDYQYLDLFEHPEFVYGNINNQDNKTDFCKYPQNIQKEMEKFGPAAVNEMKNFNSATTGNRIKFKTNSKTISFKIKLTRPYSPQKVLHYNSRGFDVYAIKKDKYIPLEVFAPGTGFDTFYHTINLNGYQDIVIFLPTYSAISYFQMGIEKNATITQFKYPEELPVLFYGNSITQGASASKSGNIFPNLVSKKLNKDIINLSCSSCCRATDNTVDLIGQIKCQSIIIDYTQNASSIGYFKDTYEQFYKKIRSYHKDIKIILMTTAVTTNTTNINGYNDVIYETYQHAIENNENTYVFNQLDCFNQEDSDLKSVDSGHFTDWGMNKIAEGLCEILLK